MALSGFTAGAAVAAPVFDAGVELRGVDILFVVGVFALLFACVETACPLLCNTIVLAGRMYVCLNKACDLCERGRRVKDKQKR